MGHKQDISTMYEIFFLKFEYLDKEIKKELIKLSRFGRYV